MFLIFGLIFMLFQSLAYTEGVSRCSSSNSDDENMNILIQNESGVIQSPGYPFSYSYKLITKCRWKIIAPKGKMIRLTFTSFQMNMYDWVDFTDNTDEWNPYFITRSGSVPSFTVYSTGRGQLGFKVHGQKGKTGPGFHATYTMIPAAVSSGSCNPKENTTVHMAGEGMSFVTPGFPEYLGKGACQWNITVPANKFVKITFWSFRAAGCKQNYAEVFDVTNSTRIFLGKFCDNQYAAEQVVYSKGNHLLVSATFINGGLVATYQAVEFTPAPYSCLNIRDIHLNETSGQFASYNYPHLYPNGVECLWQINAPAGYLIQLTFHSFDLQSSQDCKADYVEVREGAFKTLAMSNLIGRFCGSSLPGVIRSTYSNVYVDFVSDRSGGYPGFHASYTIFPDPGVGPCKLEGVDNIIPITGGTGEVFSPQFPPGTPPRSMMCTWVITVPEEQFVRFSLISHKFADNCGKRNTTLEIRDGQDSSSDLLKLYCEYPWVKEVFSSSRYLWVRFQSPKPDWSYMFRFSAVFEAVTQLPAPFACVASQPDFNLYKLTSKTGSLASYNYPLPYDRYSVECTWTISAGKYKQIELSFDSFNLSGSGSKCSDSDYVEVGNGDTPFVNSVQKFCGSEKPATVTSDDSAMWVTFSTQGKTKYPGFKASYKSVVSTKAVLKIVGICLGSLYGHFASLLALLRNTVVLVIAIDC
ncbi:hypothetical protein ACROYT_G020289 [Oculina patagonica]